jgi:hypothetical protein
MSVSQKGKHSQHKNSDTRNPPVETLEPLQISKSAAVEKEDKWRKRQAVKSVLLGCLTGKTLWYLNQARALNKAKLDIREGEQALWGNSVPGAYSEIEEEIAIREIRASEWQIRVGYANIAMYGIVLVASAWGAYYMAHNGNPFSVFSGVLCPPAFYLMVRHLKWVAYLRRLLARERAMLFKSYVEKYRLRGKTKNPLLFALILHKIGFFAKQGRGRGISPDIRRSYKELYSRRKRS